MDAQAHVQQNNASSILKLVSVFYGLAMLTFVARIYVRAAMLKFFGPDDMVMVLASGVCTAMLVCFINETHYGLGTEFASILADPVKLTGLMKWILFHNLFGVMGIGLVKISVAFFMLRIATKPFYRRFLWAAIGFSICVILVCVFTLAFECTPIQAAYDYSLRGPPTNARCFSQTTYLNLGLFNSSVNMITDFLFAILPVPIIWGLQLNMRAKVSLVAILGLGIFACVAAIVKIYEQTQIGSISWTSHDAFYTWYFIELTVGIIAANLPALKPLFNRFYETARGITSGSNGISRDARYKRNSSLGYMRTTDSTRIPLETLSADSKDGKKNRYNVQITSAGTYPRDDLDSTSWDKEGSMKSEEHILRQDVPPKGGIMQTREIEIV